MTRGPICGNRNRTKKSQNLKSSSELTYRMCKLCKLILVCTFQNITMRGGGGGGGGKGLAVFVNKINNLTTQSWKIILAFAS